MKRLAAYCRVSTDRQKDEQTIDVQKTFLSEWASKNNVSIINWYLDDGWSGEILARPELDRLRDDAKKGIWDGIVFIDRDRLARKLSLQELVIDELREKNIEVIFLNEPLADNPEGRIMQQIKGVFAEYERAKITERMRRGKIHKAKSGKVVGYRAPYGYTYILKSGEKDGYFVINEPEAEIVRMIFHWVADDGYSMYRVIQELYAKKIPPPKKKSEYWKKSAIERLLHREDYIGTTYYNRGTSVVPKRPQKIDGYKKIKKSSRKLKPKEEWITVPAPPIISKDLFEKANERLKENQLHNKRNRTYPYFLSGKVYCGCGSRRVGDGVNGHHYYRCAQRIYKFPIPVKCDYDGVNAEILDEMVWNKLLFLLSNPDVIKSQAIRWSQKENKIRLLSQPDVSHSKLALEALKEEEDRYTQAFGSKLIDFQKYKELMDEVIAKKKAIEEQQKQISETITANAVNIENIDEVCANVVNDLKRLTVEKKQKYMRAMIQSIYVKERNEALVNGYIPLYTQDQNIQYGSKDRDCRVAKCWKINLI